MTDKPLAGAQYQVYRSPIPAVKIFTLSRLSRAVSDVQRELEAQQEQFLCAIAAWRSGLSHSRVWVKQLGPPLELEVLPGVVLYLRDHAGNPKSGLPLLK